MIKQTKLAVAGLALLMSTASVQAGWFGNDNYWDDDDWPEWTPMYWMDEMFNDDDDYWGGPWGGGPGWGRGWGFTPNFSGPNFNPNFGGPNFNPNFRPMPAPPMGYYGMPVPYGPPTGGPNLPPPNFVPPQGAAPGAVPPGGMRPQFGPGPRFNPNMPPMMPGMMPPPQMAPKGAPAKAPAPAAEAK